MSQLWNAVCEALPRKLVLLDVGARGGLQYPWSMITSSLQQILVEPEPDEAARLRARPTNPDVAVLPVALWREPAELTLYVTRSPGCSSLYRPDREFLNQFPEPERFEVEREIRVNATTIDELARAGRLQNVDFAKIDVQGAELDVLTGGRSHFARELAGLEIEVEFCPMYKHQPVFSDVEPFVREAMGLELWDIRKTYWKYRAGMDVGAPKGRLVFGDALFLRPLRNIAPWLAAFDPIAAGEKVAMLVATALAYGYADYAAAVIALPEARAALTAPLEDRVQSAVACVGRGLRPMREGDGRLFLVLDAVARAVKPAHGGWAASGHSLGSRRRGPFWA